MLPHQSGTMRSTKNKLRSRNVGLMSKNALLHASRARSHIISPTKQSHNHCALCLFRRFSIGLPNHILHITNRYWILHPSAAASTSASPLVSRVLFLVSPCSSSSSTEHYGFSEPVRIPCSWIVPIYLQVASKVFTMANIGPVDASLEGRLLFAVPKSESAIPEAYPILLANS